MTIREDVTTGETTRTPALVAMPALRALPVHFDLRRYPVVQTVPARAITGAKSVADLARRLAGRVHASLRARIDALPSLQAIGRAARREALLFLRDNGFAPLAGLFALSPRLAWAMALPFAVTSLFGIFIFGIELVLVSALGLFFACLVANDAARRLQEEAKQGDAEQGDAKGRDGAKQMITLSTGIHEALPAPAEKPMMPVTVATSSRMAVNREEA